MSALCDAVRAKVRQTRTIASGIFGIRTGIMRDAIQIAATLLAFVVTVFASQRAAKELDKAAPPDDCLAAPNSSASQGSQWLRDQGLPPVRHSGVRTCPPILLMTRSIGAAEMRVLADTMKDDETWRIMNRLADDYDILADRAEGRAGRDSNVPSPLRHH